MKILLASSNPHKQEKLGDIFSDLFDNIETPKESGVVIEVDENESSFLKNAELKARLYSQKYDDYVVATDAGLTIPSLGNLWNGLYTKRFAGEAATDFDRMNKLLKLLENKRGSEREMIWNEAIAIAHKGEIIFSIQVEGIRGIAQQTFDKHKYKPGIWACSIWYFPQWNKNFFDLDTEELAQCEVSWHKLKTAVQQFFLTHTKRRELF